MNTITGVLKWEPIQTIWGAVSTCLLCAISVVFGGWDVWLETLVTFMIADYITGLTAGYCTKTLDSNIGFIGIARKIFILALVAAAFKVDIIAGTNIARYATIGFYIGREGLSIMENAGKIGIPLPSVLTDALKQLNKGDKVNE